MRWLEDALKDARYAARQLRKRGGFTAVAIVTLALGIGANTAIFSVVKTVLLEPLPYPQSDELLTLHNLRGNRNWSVHPWTPRDIFREIERSKNFEQVAGLLPQSFVVTDGERPHEIEGARVTPGFFRVLQARIALGRQFADADAGSGASRTAIISHGVWQRLFGGSPDVIGRSIRAEPVGWPPGDGELREIVGVLEPGFRLFAPRVTDPEFWIPFDAGTPMTITVARLKDGISLRRARSQMRVISRRFGLPNSNFDFDWTTLKAEVVGGDRTTLLILQWAVTVVLLIACVNLANLLLARHGARGSELALRAALGASRGRLARQTLTESVLLSALGGTAALLIAALGLELLPLVAPENVPRIDRVSIDGPVLLYTMGVAVGVGLLVGTLAAVVALRRPPGEVLEAGGRGAVLSRKPLRIGRALVITEVALVLVLLVGAGLLIRSFVTLTNRDPGFRTEDIVAISLNIPRNRYPSVPELAGFYRGALDRVATVPGIESVALSLRMPLDRGIIEEYRLEGAPEDETGNVQYELVDPGYFRTIDIPLVGGRLFNEADRAGMPRVAIVDEAMWHAAWPGEPAIGQRLRFTGEDEWLTVVGVVRGVRGSGLANDPRPGIYLPLGQGLDLGDTRAVLLVRSRMDLEQLAEPLRRAIRDVDPRQPVSGITSLERAVSASVGPHRFRAMLLGGFGAIALVLSIAGVYGVVERLTALRRREIGIRMAIGARAGDVQRRILGEAGALAGIGVSLGLLATLGLTRLLSDVLSGPASDSRPFMPQPSRVLHGVSPSEPAILAAVALFLVAVALLAGYGPARRAARIDPIVTLDAE